MHLRASMLRGQGRSIHTRGRRFQAGVVVGVVVAMLTSLGVGAAPVRMENRVARRVVWQPCGDGFECASIRVPLDYDRPHGRTIEIAMIRLPAKDPARRIGSLFTNPGGPGTSGIGHVRSLARLAYPPNVRARFDIVGFDPRGVGASTPVRCFASPEAQQEFFGRGPIIPVTRRQFRQAVADATELARRCKARAGWLLPHLSTANVARDLDMLRAAVGDARLSYVGYSYGTYLGATFANLFPHRARAVVLDGLVNAPAYSRGPQPSTTFVRQKSHIGSSVTLRQFFRLCRLAGSRCAFGAHGQPSRKFGTLTRRLLRRPLTLPNGSTFGYSELVVSTIQSLFEPDIWDELARALHQLYVATRPENAATRLRQLASQESVRYDNSIEAYLASVCGETQNPRNPRAYRRLARQADRRTSYVGSYWTYITLPCSRWPAQDQDRFSGPWAVRTHNPLLLLNPRFDPASPHRNATAMNKLLSHSRLLTIDGWAHTALSTRSACGDGTVERYLLNGTLPRPGAVCPTGIVPFTFSG
jgi:pimeloyl-ACP methyl ester carboxylesterase